MSDKVSVIYLYSISIFTFETKIIFYVPLNNLLFNNNENNKRQNMKFIFEIKK